MGGAGSLTPPPRAWAETSTRAAACGSPSTVKIGKVTGDPSPGKDAQRPAPLCMDTVGGGAQGSKAVAILPLPMQGCKVVSPPTQECKVLCSPLTPPKKKPPKCKHQKTAKRGRPPKPYKATGTPPPPSPPAATRSPPPAPRGGSGRAARRRRPRGRCGAAAAAVPGAPRRSAVLAQRMCPPRPAPPRAAPLSPAPLRAGGRGPAAPGAVGAPRSAPPGGDAGRGRSLLPFPATATSAGPAAG